MEGTKYTPEGTIVDGGAFTVRVPHGKRWEVVADSQKGVVSFRGPLYFILTIRENAEEGFMAETDEEVIQRIFTRIVETMNEEGKKEHYSVLGIEKESVVRCDKTLYGMKWRRWPLGILGSTTYHERMFVYLPINFRRDRVFYRFHMAEVAPRGGGIARKLKESSRLDELFQVIDSLRVK